MNEKKEDKLRVLYPVSCIPKGLELQVLLSSLEDYKVLFYEKGVDGEEPQVFDGGVMLINLDSLDLLTESELEKINKLLEDGSTTGKEVAEDIFEKSQKNNEKIIRLLREMRGANTDESNKNKE